jgi:phosphate uptake regulator
MRRKVSKIGSSTLMVSLPAKWVKANHINKGDEVEIIEEGSKLEIVSNKSRPNKDKIILDVNDFGTYTLRCLAAMYRKGYDEIEIRFTEPGIIKKIQEYVTYLIGFEIVKQGKNFCIVRSISDGLEMEFDSVLRRTFLLLLSMAEDSLGIIKKGNIEALNDIYYLEETNNKFTTFCRRLLIKNSHNNCKEVPSIYYVVEELEKIADEYKYLCYYLTKRNDKSKISDETLKVYQEVNKLLRLFYESYYKFDINKSLEISRKRKKIIKDIYTKFDDESKKEIRILHHLINITQMTANMSTVYLVAKI